MRIVFLVLATLLGLIVQTMGSTAQVCNFTFTNVNFGNIGIGPGGTPSTSSTFTANCSGSPNRTITICPNIGDGTGGSSGGSPRLLLNGAATIPFDFIQPNGQVWGSYVWPYAARPPILSLTLNSQGTGALSQSVQAIISGSIASAPTGLYTSNYAANHTLIDYGYAPGQNCNVATARKTQAPFVVQANNVATCNLSTTPLDFGTLSGLTTAQVATGQIGITCTRNANYTISLSNGINGGAGPTARRMVSISSPGSAITYGVYRDASHVQPWGQTIGSDTVSGVGTGLQQNIVAYGYLPAQGNPAPASYSDTVVVTVSY
jgi:spore coat protein U-like protein